MKNNNLSKIVVGIIIIVLIWFIISNLSNTNKSGLPKYALKNERVKEAYMFAVENPDALNGMVCSCGCMSHLHDGRIHSRGLLDCFRNGNGFEMHGSECDMCINAALDVKNMFNSNSTKEQIKEYLEKNY